MLPPFGAADGVPPRAAVLALALIAGCAAVPQEWCAGLSFSEPVILASVSLYATGRGGSGPGSPRMLSDRLSRPYGVYQIGEM